MQEELEYIFLYENNNYILNPEEKTLDAIRREIKDTLQSEIKDGVQTDDFSLFFHKNNVKIKLVKDKNIPPSGSTLFLETW